jgi:hypothetical protein
MRIYRQTGFMSLLALLLMAAVWLAAATVASMGVRVKSARQVTTIQGLAIELLTGSDVYYQTKCMLGNVPLTVLDGQYIQTPRLLFTSAYVRHWQVVIQRPDHEARVLVTADIAVPYLAERLTERLIPGMTVTKLSSTQAPWITVQWVKGLALQTPMQTRHRFEQRELGLSSGCT